MTAPSHTDTPADRPSRSGSRRRRRWVGLAVLVAIALVGFVLVWFQPQVLLFDTVVEDEFPGATPNEDAASDPEEEVTPAPEPGSTDGDPTAAEERSPSPDDTAAPTDEDEESDEEAAADAADASAASEEPVALATGAFESRNRYTVTGGATVYELPDAERIVRLEGFESTNGPDLFVYLTVGDATEPSDAALAEEYVDLGVLRGNVGDQNYAIPDDVDLSRFDTVVIWCRRFSTAFGAADLR